MPQGKNTKAVSKKSNGKGKYAYTGIAIALIASILILSSGTLNAATVSGIKSAIFSPLNTPAPLFAPICGIYGCPFTATLSAVPLAINFNNPINLTANWSGGTGPYSLTIYASKNSSCSSSSIPIASQSNLTDHPLLYRRTYYPPGAYFCVVVTDSTGATATSSATFVVINNVPTTTIIPSLSGVTLTVNPTTFIYPNGTAIFTSNWFGGVPPYSVGLYVSKTPTCNASDTVVRDIPNVTSSTQLGERTNFYPPGGYFCSVITDSRGMTGTSNPVFVTINSATTTSVSTTASSTSTSTSLTSTSSLSTTTIPVFTSSLSASPTTINVTQTTTFTLSWSGAGGKAPYSITIYASPTSSCTTLIPIASESNLNSGPIQLRKSYFAPGSYFCAIVTSSNGNTALSNPVFVTINS